LFLLERGYKIIVRNFKNILGEIDIVAQDKDVICFVEVRTRKDPFKQREALESVGALKQRKLSRMAVSFLKEKHWLGRKARFDVMAISLEAAQDDVILLKNAFPVIERYA